MRRRKKGAEACFFTQQILAPAENLIDGLGLTIRAGLCDTTTVKVAPLMDPARSHSAPPEARARVPLSKESMAFAARLDAAEAAVRRQDFRTAVHLLHRAPTLLQGIGDGRVLELMALCASHNAQAAAGDPWALWHRCLAAYQDAQDARGTERAHRALGLWAYGRGELAVASGELRRAQRLLERQHRPEACVVGLCQQAEVAMAQGRDAIDDAQRWADEAVMQCQHNEGWGLLEARARLMRARALCLVGAIGEAALDMLWAERLAAPHVRPTGRAMNHEALQLVMCRAESLMLLGHPRRAATCLSTIDAAARATSQSDVLAHYQLLVSQALVGDLPHDAHAAGLAAQHFYSVRKQAYFRAQSEVALVRSALRLGQDDVQARVRALKAQKLERWPLLAFNFGRAQEEVETPHKHTLGAVKTPWMRAVGKIDLGPNAPMAEAMGAHDTDAGFMARLNHAIGRVTGEDEHHATPNQARS